MSETPVVTKALLREMRETQQGDPWYGGARATILQGVSARAASSHPIASAHSIWELVLHMTAWTREVHRRLAGAEPGEPQDGDWPRVTDTSEAAWQRACADLDKAHADIMAAIAAMPQAQWTAPVGKSRDAPLGTGVDIAGMLVGLAQHDAYHTGQIGILKKAF